MSRRKNPTYRFNWLGIVFLSILLGILPAAADFSLYFLHDIESSHHVSLVFILFLLGLLSVPIAVFFSIKKEQPILLFGLLPYAIVLLDELSNLMSFPLPDEFVAAGFVYAAQLAFLIYLWRASLLSWHFAAVFVCLWVGTSPIQALVFAGVSLMLRLLMLLFTQNVETVRKLGFAKLIRIFLKALLLWSPMLVVVIPSYYFSKYVEQQVADGLYGQTFLNTYTSPRDFEKDLSLSLDSLSSVAKDTAYAKTAAIRETSGDVRTELPIAIGDIIRSSMSPPRVNVRKKCRWYQVGCHIGKGAAKAAAKATEIAFKETGENLANNMENATSELLIEIDADANTGLDVINSRVDTVIEMVEDRIRRFTLFFYRLMLLILLVLDIGFFFIVLKSFTYVFARVLFSEENDAFVSLRSSSGNMKNGSIRKAGSNYTISANTRMDFYVSRRYEPSGRAPKICLPQAARSSLSRILHGAFTMNHVIMEAGRSSVKFHAGGGHEFVEWTLEPGEVVIFHYRDFVAVSETVRLNTIISLRLESLLLGRFTFSTATGPGKLVLRSKGNPVAGTQTAASAAIPENRLLAWQQNTRFAVESELNVFDVFFSGVYLKKQGSDLVIIDSDQTGRSKSGIKKFFLHFLLPR